MFGFVLLILRYLSAMIQRATGYSPKLIFAYIVMLIKMKWEDLLTYIIKNDMTTLMRMANTVFYWLGDYNVLTYHVGGTSETCRVSHYHIDFVNNTKIRFAIKFLCRYHYHPKKEDDEILDLSLFDIPRNERLIILIIDKKTKETTKITIFGEQIIYHRKNIMADTDGDPIKIETMVFNQVPLHC